MNAIEREQIDANQVIEAYQERTNQLTTENVQLVALLKKRNKEIELLKEATNETHEKD